jgi:hypothetical protein
VVRVYGFGQLPDITSGRKEVKRLTGQSFVPVLVLDDGQVIRETNNIITWARANPAAEPESSAGAHPLGITDPA